MGKLYLRETMKKVQPIKEIISSQDDLITIFLTAVFLASGVNLLINQCLILIIVGIVLIFLSFLCLILVLITKKGRVHEEFKAFFIYNKKKNKFEEIPEYEFSSDQITFMNAVFAESINLKEFWKTKPLNNGFPIEDNLKKFINELTEYCILNKLFTHNEDYFNKSGFTPSDIKKIERNDFPELLVKNRFLEIISKPMSERALFNFEKESDDLNIVSANGKNDALFDRFDLYLPKNCILRKPTDNVIIIDSDLMCISITTNFEGFSTCLPNQFVKSYLKIDNEIKTISTFQIEIIVDINIKIKSLFLKGDLKYYRWVDEFLQTLVTYLSDDAFFERINWNTAITMLHCYNEMSNGSVSGNEKLP